MAIIVKKMLNFAKRYAKYAIANFSKKPQHHSNWIFLSTLHYLRVLKLLQVSEKQILRNIYIS